MPQLARWIALLCPRLSSTEFGWTESGNSHSISSDPALCHGKDVTEGQSKLLEAVIFPSFMKRRP